jgi:hypothetical protein
MLTRRMRGALDLGLVLLPEEPVEGYTRFVNDHVAAPMRAAALLLRLSVAECVREPALTPFEAIEVDTEAFVSALAELSGFRSVAEEELRAVCGRLAVAFRRLTDSFLDIAERLCFEPSFAAELGAQRRVAIEQAIRDLPTELFAGREGEGRA